MKLRSIWDGPFGTADEVVSCLVAAREVLMEFYPHVPQISGRVSEVPLALFFEITDGNNLELNLEGNSFELSPLVGADLIQMDGGLDAPMDMQFGPMERDIAGFRMQGREEAGDYLVPLSSLPPSLSLASFSLEWV